MYVCLYSCFGGAQSFGLLHQQSAMPAAKLTWVSGPLDLCPASALGRCQVAK